MGRIDLSGFVLLAFVAVGALAGVVAAALVMLAGVIFTFTVPGSWVLGIIAGGICAGGVFYKFAWGAP